MLSCQSIGRCDEETGLLEWMSTVTDTRTGQVLATTSTVLDPAARDLDCLLKKACVFPLASGVPRQIPKTVYVAHRLRRCFDTLRRKNQGIEWILQSRAEEKTSAENGLDA